MIQQLVNAAARGGHAGMRRRSCKTANFVIAQFSSMNPVNCRDFTSRTVSGLGEKTAFSRVWKGQKQHGEEV
jgi:hypothetical protein